MVIALSSCLHRAPLWALLLVPLSGCFVASDLDRFEADDGCDLQLGLEAFTPHLNQTVEIRGVFRPQDGPASLRARAILDPLSAVDTSVLMPNAIAEGPHSIDFFADFNEDGVYSDPPTDHTWRIDDACAGAPNPFVHVFDFQALDDPIGLGGDLAASFTGMAADGNAFELRATALIPQGDGASVRRTVAVYHTPAVTSPDFEVRVPDVIDSGFEYELEFWADSNGNDRYDPPPTDEAWRLTVPGTTVEEFSFAHVEEYIDIERILVTVSP